MAEEIKFTQDNLNRIEELRRRYPTSKALTLPVLWIAQDQFGYISTEVMKYIAGIIDVPYRHILGVVTFYTMFHPHKKGKYHIEVCTNVSCSLRGAEKIVEHLETKLGIKLGETSNDMKFTLSEVECMGSCGTAPMLAIGEEYYENLTIEKVDQILASLR
jgi:NADH-quinone oxidoreductase E subunit